MQKLVAVRLLGSSPHMGKMYHHHFIFSKTKDAAMQTKDIDVEQDTPGSDKLLQWPLKKYKKTQNIAIVRNILWTLWLPYKQKDLYKFTFS